MESPVEAFWRTSLMLTFGARGRRLLDGRGDERFLWFRFFFEAILCHASKRPISRRSSCFEEYCSLIERWSNFAFF